MRDEDGAHACLLGAEDVIPEPVAHEDTLGGPHAQHRSNRRECLFVWLCDGHLARIGGTVDEVDELVAQEYLFVVRARPHGVAQYADLQAHRPQLAQERGRLRICERVGCPEVKIVAEGS